ncbi:hypothetical protein CL618_03855, partial [archaeon]|nr:hypothetical protein [archaeon]
MSLTEQLNKHIEREPVIKPYTGPIPWIVPTIKLDGRTPADGDYVLNLLLQALQSEDPERINAFETQWYDLADAIIPSKTGLVKLQKDSPFIKGIQGVLENQVAIDAEALAQGITDTQHFPVTDSVEATYLKDGQKQTHQVENVVLLPYDGSSIHLTTPQFDAVSAEPVRRKDMILDRDLTQEEITQHPLWKQYSVDLEALAQEVAKHTERERNMGMYVPSTPQEGAEIRAAYLDRLDNRSRLNGGDHLGNGNACLLGVVNVAEGDA